MIDNSKIVTQIASLYTQYDQNYDKVIKSRAETDFMASDNYFDVGRSAIGAITAALISAGISYPKSILDFACGNGRVTRHLKLMFPDSEIVACDLYPEMVDFCERTFEVSGHISSEDFENIRFDRSFDLIWCGSMLTHCNKKMFSDALNVMQKALSVPGVAVASVHGRRAISLQRYFWKMSPESAFRPAEREFNKEGFAYMQASREEAESHFPLNVNLGLGNSLSSMSYVTKLIEEMENAQLVYYREMAWNGHQDVFAISRPGVWPSDQ